MSNRQYLKAEVLKHHHTAINKILIFMPVICAVMSAFLTNIYFAAAGFNWWYMGIYTGFIALICGLLVGKEKKMKNRAILALPCDMGKIWDAKVLYGTLLSGAAMLLLMVLVILISFLLEHVLKVTFVIEPSLSSQLAAGALLWLSFCWQIPWCLLLAQTLGRTVMLILHLVLYNVMAIFVSLLPVYMFFPGALGGEDDVSGTWNTSQWSSGTVRGNDIYAEADGQFQYSGRDCCFYPLVSASVGHWKNLL